MPLQRRLQMDVALRTRAANIGHQREIRLIKYAGPSAFLARRSGSGFPWNFVAVVAADAELVEHRLDLASETESAGRTVPRRDFRCRLESGHPPRLLMGGAEFDSSWQPTQESVSPGIAVYQLRMTCSARPSASSGCTAIGVLAGTLNIAEPSPLTGTVPRIRWTSHGPSMPTARSPPMPE